MSEGLIQRWRRWAEEATPVARICTVPEDGRMVSTLSAEDWQVIANGMAFEDARFFAEARQAVMALSDELTRVWAYVEYLSTADAPRTYEEWLQLAELERRR